MTKFGAQNMKYRTNRQIRSTEVRIIEDGKESIILSTKEAIKEAENRGLDLVEISANAQPPVCRIVDYSKFLYQQKKRQKELKTKQVKMDVKEVRFGPQTDEHDFNFKLKHAQSFLESGNKVKAYVFFRGRSILFKEQGEMLLLRFASELEEYGKVEQMPVLEGKRMIIFISPKKNISPKKTKEVIENEEVKATRKSPKQNIKKEYKGPKVEGESF